MSEKNALQVNALHKFYANRFHALKGINLQVEDKDFFALLGPNGAGKSTLIGIITSLINFSDGKIQVYGHDIQKQPSKAKALIGLVPQEVNMNQFDKTLDVVITQAGYYGIPHKTAYARAKEHLKRMELWDVHNIEVRQLSGGMKRRLMIARTLVHRPRLLILDEPTAGVDVEVRHLIWDYMQELNAQGTTIILTTHYLEEAEKWCRNIAIINNGEILENTTMRELLASLRKESYTLYLKDPIDAAPVLENAETCWVDAITLEVTLVGKQNLASIFSQIKGLGIEVQAIRNKTNRLEELFMQIIKR